MQVGVLGLLVAALLEVTAMGSSADTVLHGQAFDAALKPTRSWTWAAGGEVVALVGVPDGGMAAVVRTAAGTAELVHWSVEGKETSRRVAAVKGRAERARLRRDGSWVVLTNLEVAQVGPGGEVQRRRARGGERPENEVTGMEAGEEGAWLALPGRLVHLALDGTEVSIPRPLDAGPLDVCRKEFARPQECRWTQVVVRLLPLADGGCLVAETLEIYHNASGPNLTDQVVVHRLGRRGKVAARLLIGETRSSLEWFNFDSSPGNFTGLPGKFTLVRRTYSGSTVLSNMAERASGDLLIVAKGGGPSLRLVDAALAPRWSRNVQAFGWQALSPPWSKGILAFSGMDWLEAFDEKGSPIGGKVEIAVPGGDPGKMHHAIGQTPTGEWLLVSY